MTNKNSWELTGDYLYGLYYDFELSGTLAEKQQTYLQLLKDVLMAEQVL